ncbi:MAG: xanthine dehydrogenase family protein molybdopterin-binding subunit, partial [Ilumatobacteraceae bacterium]
MAGSGSILGNSVLRLEDPTLLTGDGKYVDDLRETGMLFVALVRSPVAHGTINSVDTGDAASMPGVVAVYHAGNDLGMPAMQGFPMMPPDFNRPIFASEKVRFVGDIIAAVVAETQAQANDAAQEIFADIDPLPAIIDPRDGLAPDAPLLFEPTGSNICFASHFPAEGGGDDPCAGADVVAEVEMVSQRLAGVPMENNGVVCVPQDGGGLTMWISHQAPHSVHAAYAPMLGLDAEALRLVCPWVGGGFGPKAAPYVEHLIAAKAAMMLGKPVKWVEARSENMVSMVHGRDFVMKARLGVNRDGKIVGLDGEVVAAAGAYPLIGAILPMLTQMMSVGVYEIPNVRFDAKTVLTNNTPIGAYRGAGRPEATQLIERVLDVAADLIGMDPAEIRRVNFMQPDTFPRTTITGANYDSGE